MRKFILLAGCLAVLSTSVVGSAGVASNVRAFADPSGDACCTEDITRVVVTNDDAGTITFAITAQVDAEGAQGASDSFIDIETEHERYQIGSNSDTPGFGFFVLTAYGERVRVATIHASIENDGLFRFFRFPVDRHLLGDADRFDFDVEFWEVTPLAAHLEAAPDRGVWTFPIKINLRRIRPVLAAPQVRHRSRTLVARLGLQVGRTHQLLASGTIACAASVRGRELVVLERRFVHRRALCRWRLPRRLHTKTPIWGRVAVRVTEAPKSVKAKTFRFVAS
jgi:hypothetical protein